MFKTPSFSWLKQQPSQVHQFGLTQLQFWLRCDLNWLQAEATATLAPDSKTTTASYMLIIATQLQILNNIIP
jgi:hypothetical protein